MVDVIIGEVGRRVNHMDSGFEGLAGAPHHQNLLRAVVTHYKDDPRILAVVLFGSLARGDWDRYSDLDLDVIVGDDIHVDVRAEALTLCARFEEVSEPPALIIPSGSEAVDIVLLSRTELSIRYHPLDTTSPNIIDSMFVLTGSIDAATIARAGQARRRPVMRSAAERLDACVRYAVEVSVALQRNHPWMAVELLHRMRILLMEIFASSRDEPRAIHSFEATASPTLQRRLAATLPSFDQNALRDALVAMLDVLGHDLPELADESVAVTDVHRALLSDVRREVMSGKW